MADDKFTVEAWLDAAVDAVGEIAESLGYEETQRGDRNAQVPTGRLGAYVPMLAHDASLHIGLIAEKDGLVQLTQALLGMDPSEEAPEPSDVADAVGEITNMLAGGVKTRLVEQDPEIKLGLPLFVDGKIELSGSMEARTAQVTMGTVNAAILVLRTPK